MLRFPALSKQRIFAGIACGIDLDLPYFTSDKFKKYSHKTMSGL